MITNLANRWKRGVAALPPGPQPGPSDAERGGFRLRLREIDRDPYLFVADEALQLISVFDDLKYDRADVDLLNGAMRKRALKRLKPLGFQQRSGGVLENEALDIRMLMPKFRALGASPFDAVRDTPRRPQDYYILTPTQAACQFIENYPHGEAVEKIKSLIVRHPINIYRMMDYFERNERHRAMQRAIGHLKLVQREAVEAEPLRTRRALN